MHMKQNSISNKMAVVSLLRGIHKVIVTSHDAYFYPSITSVRINEFINSSMKYLFILNTAYQMSGLIDNSIVNCGSLNT